MVADAVILDQVNDALKKVIDPHMSINLDEMGMIREVKINGEGVAKVGIVLPCIGCPALELMRADIKREVSEIAGITAVKVKTLWGEKWDRENISEEGRKNAATHGYVI